MDPLVQFFTTPLSEQELEISKDLGYERKSDLFKKLLMLVVKRSEIEGDLTDLADIIQPEFFNLTLNIPVSQFICSTFGELTCTPMGAKIGDSLIRVAATRIFADPEQSIMELPVNSVDSYNSKLGIPAVGKFGMGFFSILYWISEPLNGKWERSLTVSTVVEGDEKFMHVVKLQWNSTGLSVNRTKSETKKSAGTTIAIDASKHNFTSESIETMMLYMDRLFAIEGARIILNGMQINKNCNSQNEVTVTISPSQIVVEDNARGIPFSVIENSLLVPSSSSKVRDLTTPEFKSPEILDLSSRRNKSLNRLSIIINGVCVVETMCEKLSISPTFENYVIYLPFNSKLPVSRDDVIFEDGSDAIEHFKEAVYTLVDQILSRDRNIYKLFLLISKYVVINKSTALNRAFKEISDAVLKSEYIFVKGSDFWYDAIRGTKSKIKDLLVFTNHIDVFETERKILAAIPSAKKNIFKCRNVVATSFPIRTNIETGGLNSILFIESKNLKDPDFISKLVFSHTESLLISHDDQFSIDTDLNSDVPSEVVDSMSVCLMTISRKFLTCNSISNVLMKVPGEFLEKLIQIVGQKSDLLISLLYALNSKISKIKINLSYGLLNPAIYNTNRMYYTKREDDKLHPKIKTKLLEFYIECIPDSLGIFMIFPNIEDFCIYESGLFEGLDHYELGKGEIFILNSIQRILEHQKSAEDLTFWAAVKNVGHFALSELRRYTENSKIENFMKSFYNTIGSFDELKTNVINPINQAVLKFIENTLKFNKLPRFSIFFEGRYKFSCKSLLSFIFQNKELPDLATLNDHYIEFGDTKTKLQILEIAVNEGTTKRFIPSIITEMVQNSVDAIRSTNGKRRIDINIGANFFTISDYIGMENFINILIPFLSTKNPNDPNVTGEMGTGFFNVYRQPYVKQVAIRTCINQIETIILARPIVENGNVVDITYHISRENSNKQGTSISVIFNDNVAIISSLIVESRMFIMNYLCFISSADIYVEGRPISSNFKTIYESNVGSILLTSDPSLGSYVLTNDIPFCTMAEFIQNEFIDESLRDGIEKYLLYGVVVNLKKFVYTPTQARNKIQIKKEFTEDVKMFISELLTNSLCNKYINHTLSNPDNMITFTSSAANPKNLGELNDRCGYFISLLKPKIDIVKEINDLASRVKSLTELPRNTLKDKVIYEWFRLKNFDSNGGKGSKGASKITQTQNLRVKCDHLTRFTRILWTHLAKLKSENKISGFTLMEPPSVFFDRLEDNTLGEYSMSKNEIQLNVDYHDRDELETEINKTTIESIRQSPASFVMNPIFRRYFSVSLPVCPFVHELTHAILNTTHTNEAHANTSVRIENLGPGLSFDETASLLFTAALESGVINEFFS